MRSFFIASGIALAAMLGNAHAATTIPGGNIINQIWTPASSPYIVQGDITVPSGAFLTIQAGTVVQFSSTDGQAAGQDTSRVELTVKGTLNVDGTAANPATFQAQSGTSSAVWYGIVIDATATAATIIHADIQNASYAVSSSAAANALALSFSTLHNSGTGIYLLAGTPTLDALTISDCNTGITVSNSAGGTISNAVIRQNSGFGIYYTVSTGNAALLLTQSTIYANEYGVLDERGAGSSAVLTINNSIISQNSVGGVISGTADGSVLITYSDVIGNTMNYLNATPGEGSISADPLFVTTPTDLQLQPGSPCIDAGSSLNASDHDRNGSMRPLDGGGPNSAGYDMGAYEAPDVIFADGFEGS